MSRQEILERRFYSKGDLIFSEGEEGYVAFIIQSGCVSVFSKRDGKKHEFTKLNAGDIFGETALLTDKPRSASVEAIEDSNMIIIRRDIFEKKLKKSDPTIRAVVDMLTSRIMHSNSQLLRLKGTGLEYSIGVINALFEDILSAMPDSEKQAFKDEAFPILGQLIRVIEKNYKN
jgi:CRP/FNR family cyclic AMP-dependent transcriptional regulator